MKISSKIPVIPLDFWDELFKAQKSEWVAIVKKYELNSEQLNYIAAHKDEVFTRLQASEESKKSWNDGVTKYYSKV